MDKFDVNNYLDCLANLGESAKAERVMMEQINNPNVHCTPVWVNTVIAGGGLDYNSNLSLRVLRKCENGDYPGISPSGRTYQSALGALCHDGLRGAKWMDCYRFLKDMKDGKSPLGIKEDDCGKVLSR